MAVNKISPLDYITDVDPVDEPILSASDWYETETKILDEIDTSDTVPWLLAQGWTVTDVTDSVETEPFYSATGVLIGSTTTTTKQTTLERRVLKSEYALNSLIASFTNAYNEGRTLNDSRYDELVTLYAVMLDKTEDEIIDNTDDPDEYSALIETILETMGTDYDDVESDLDGALDDYGDAQRARIATQFDNKLTETKADLITRGLYNTTIWDSMSTGIERERAFALNDFEDGLIGQQVNLRSTIYNYKDNLNVKLLEARSRLRNELQGGLEKTSLRNQALQSMLSFMERREDGYPDMAAIADLTKSLGINSSQTQSP